MVAPLVMALIEFDDLTSDQLELLESHPLTVRRPGKPSKSQPIWVCGFHVADPAEINEVAQEIHVWAVRNQIPYRRLIQDDS